MERALLVSVLLVESLVLLFVAKLLWGLVLRRNVDQELTTHDNPAAAITVSGYFLGVFIALTGVMGSPSQGLLKDALGFGAFGLAGVVLLFLSVFGAPLVGGVKLRRDIVENRNVGSALVLLASFVATGLIFAGAVRGEGAGPMAWVTLLVFQLVGQVLLALTAQLFKLMTRFKLHDEIAQARNTAAAVGFAGALVAIGIVLNRAVAGSFAGWTTSLGGVLIYSLPLLLLWPVRALVVNGLLLGFKGLDREIAVDRNVGAGVVEASAYIGLALLAVTAAH
ncbi:MAG: DUF350 domain-containing protein [Deltaproteobacteria bacterium]|nr:DUF350 domain-containing protein [Deltaproteobacteria bacterium]